MLGAHAGSTGSVDEREVDRLSELANIGAGHAATALARLAGRPVWTRVPRVRSLVAEDSEEAVPPVSPSVGRSGIFFELEGCFGALVGILFRTPQCEAVARSLLDTGESDLDPALVRSALCEVGNILVSHLASAIADTVGERLLPSTPTLAMGDADRELLVLSEQRAGEHPICIECELTDERGELGGLLVLIPDAT